MLIKRKTLKYATAIGSICLAPISHAHAITLDELKGYSIQVTGTITGVFRSNDPTVPRSGRMQFDNRVYISQTGNIFSYGHNTEGTFAEQNQHVSELDQATSSTRQRMGAWTIEGGNLTRITHHVEGFTISTIVIDPSRSTCTAAATMQPDPTTHRFMRQWMQGRVTEMTSISLDSYTCTIKKGNVFATDQ